MKNLLFILNLLIVIVIMIIIITLFFNNIILLKNKSNKSSYFQTFDNLFSKNYFKSKLKGCYKGKCINGGYCRDCQGDKSTCCCYDFQCSK